jgi:DNA-binding LacI/PurR family transcriptional regulator
VTIRDVAKECGVSATTVSMVLNDAPLATYIPESTKKRIVHVAEGMGYQPNPFAQALRRRHSHTIGVMVPDIADPYCAQILRGIEKSFSRSNYLPFLVDIQNNRLRFKKYLSVLLARRVDGLIILANSLSFETELLSGLESRKIPCVILGREPGTDALSWVATDHEIGTQQALKHLHQLAHRKIAFIRGPKMIIDSHHQWSGETVQLYVHERFTPVATPIKQLRGFERVGLDPGEKKTVKFALGPEDLQLLDKNMRWVLVPGTFEIMVGRSSEDVAAKGTVEVKAPEFTVNHK